MLAKTKIAGLMVALMTLSVPLVYADNGDFHHGQHEQMMAKVLNLSDDQVKQLKDIWEKSKASMKAVHEQMKANREALDAEIVKSAPDMNKVNDLQTQFKALQAQKTDAHLNALLDIKKILTPEQFAGFMALKKESRLKKHMMEHGRFDHKDGDKD